MSSGVKRTLIVLAASLTVIVVGWVMLIGSVLALGGVATVKLMERHGSSVTIPIPMAVVDAVVASGDAVFDSTQHLDIDVDLGEWKPVVQGMLEALDECPDVVLVSVEDGEDSVEIEKVGSALVLRIRDSKVDVRVNVPLRSVRRTVGRLLS